MGEGGGSSAGVPSHGLACRSTTPASGQSPRCCGPSARARQSRACSEPQAAPQVRAPARVSPECASSRRGLLSRPAGTPSSPWPSMLPCLPALAALSLGSIPPTVVAHGPSPAGTCLRLYSEAFHEQRLPPSPAPHVSETSLSRLVLLLKRLDIADMGQCDFLDRPGSARGVRRGRAQRGGAGAEGRDRGGHAGGAGGWPWPSVQPGLSLERGLEGPAGAGGGWAELPGPGSQLTSCPSPRVADASAGGPGLPGCPGR